MKARLPLVYSRAGCSGVTPMANAIALLPKPEAIAGMRGGMAGLACMLRGVGLDLAFDGCAMRGVGAPPGQAGAHVA